MFKTNTFFNFGVSFFYIFLRKIFWRRKVSWECTPECSKLSWRFSRLPGGSATLVGQWQERIKLSCQRLNRRFIGNGSKRRRLLLVSRIANLQWPKSVTTIQFSSQQFQFVHGNFNLLTAISILLTAISICSRQFQLTHGNFNYLCLRLIQFTHGNFNLFTAISICPRQFQFTHGNFNFLTANNAHCIFRFAHHVKRQNQKSIFKVDLQSEKWKSKIENRFANTYASRQWVDNRRVLLVPENYKLYQTLTWWTVNIYCTASQNGSIPHINPSIEATSNCSKSCLLMLLVAVLLFLLTKSKNGGAIRKNVTCYLWARTESLFCLVWERYGLRPARK